MKYIIEFVGCLWIRRISVNSLDFCEFVRFLWTRIMSVNSSDLCDFSGFLIILWISVNSSDFCELVGFLWTRSLDFEAYRNEVLPNVLWNLGVVLIGKPNPTCLDRFSLICLCACLFVCLFVCMIFNIVCANTFFSVCCFWIHSVQSVINNPAQLPGRGFPYIFVYEFVFAITLRFFLVLPTPPRPTLRPEIACVHGSASIWEHKQRNVATNIISYKRYREILFQKVALCYLLHFVQDGSSKNALEKYLSAQMSKNKNWGTTPLISPPPLTPDQPAFKGGRSLTGGASGRAVPQPHPPRARPP